MTREEAARLLGAKLREVVAITAVDGGHVVTNHVGNHTLITDTGEFVFGVDAPPAASPDADPAPDGAVVEASAPGEQVPAGPVAAVLEWVGEDRDRAAAALAAEQAAASPRKTLVEQLGKLAGDGDG